MGNMKLHFGCGTVIKEGWTNVDVWFPPCVKVELVEYPEGVWGDLEEGETDYNPYTRFIQLQSPTDLSCIPAGSVEELFSDNALEHLHPYEVYEIMGEFLRVLKPGGMMNHIVPNFDSLAQMWHTNNWKYNQAKESRSDDRTQAIFDYERYNTICNGVLSPKVGQNMSPHKSLWGKEYAEFLLSRWGFLNTKITVGDNLEILSYAPQGGHNTISEK
jgi:hypothetical protein